MSLSLLVMLIPVLSLIYDSVLGLQRKCSYNTTTTATVIGPECVTSSRSLCCQARTKNKPSLLAASLHRCLLVSVAEISVKSSC